MDYREIEPNLAGLWPEIVSMYGMDKPEFKGVNTRNGPCPLCGGDDRAHWHDCGQGRIALFCRNCAPGPMKSVEDVCMEYSGRGFREFVEDMASYINHTPIEKIARAKKQSAKPKRRYPHDHKENAELTKGLLASCQKEKRGGLTFYHAENGFYLPIYNVDKEFVNAAHFEGGKLMRFVAGGVTYGGFTPIKVNNDSKWLACVSLSDGRWLAHTTNKNVAVCWSDLSIRWFCYHEKPEQIKVAPVLTKDDDNWLAYEMKWLSLDGDKLEKKEMIL